MFPIEKIIAGATENFIAPFLWLHNEDDALIVKELHRIHDCGIGAVCIESRTHEEFCKEDWWSDVRLIIDTCKTLGMKLWILDDKHFPSGYANGIFKKEENKHLRAICIRAGRIDMAGPVKYACVLADEWKALPEDTFLGAVLLRRTEDGMGFSGEYIDISDGFANGRYYFNLPEGMWSVVLLIKTQGDLAPGHRIFGNKLLTEATDAYIKEVYEAHYEHFAEDFGDTILGFFSDEPQFHNNYGQPLNIVPIGEAFAGYPWEDSILPLLQNAYGKDWIKMLCGLWYSMEDGSHRKSREKYMDIITKGYSQAFCKRIGNWCEDHGVMYIGHVIEDNGAHKCTGYGVGHYFRALEGQHMAGIDVVLHQLMPGLCQVANTGSVSYKEMDNVQNNYILGKLASSAAHTEPRKKGRAMCEIFGAFGWAEDMAFMKYLLDHFIVRGINYFVPHAFSPKENDLDCPPNFYNTGKNPQYKYFGMLMSYINRMCSLTKDSIHVPVCAVIYDGEASWGTKDYTDNKEICKLLYDAQLDYDIIPFERLDDMSADGCINGEYYPVILLPYSEYYSDENLERIAKHKDRMVCVGNKGIEGVKQVAIPELVNFMEEYRDISIKGDGRFLRYAHYDRNGEQCYILSNEDTSPKSIVLNIKGFSGGKYLLWDAFENKILCRCSRDKDIPLHIYPDNLIVLLTDSDYSCGDGMLINDPMGGEEILETEWTIELCKERDLPDYKLYKKTKELNNITGPKEIPDYTGNIRYTGTVILNREKHKVLDLGYVGQTAEVKLNGINLGRRPFPPYRFDISGAVKEGENILEIIVTNTCVYEQRDHFSRYMLIKPSGLIGPVCAGLSL